MARTIVIGVVVAIVASLALIIGLVVSSVERLDSTEMGVMYDTIAKTLRDTVQFGGLHLGPVGFQFISAPSVYQSISESIKCLNKDGISIEVSMTYQFRIIPQKYREVIVQFKNAEDFKTILRAVGEQSVHDVCAEFNTTEIQLNRDSFTNAIRVAIKKNLNDLDTEVSGVQISNYDRPDELEKAIQTKERAREDIRVAERETNKKMVEAETKVRVAEKQANITLEAAYSYKRIREIEAENRAKTITTQFQAELDTYISIKSSLKLTIEGLLSYMGVRILEKSPNQVNIAVEAPAKFSYVANP